jgi:hypothetical protein
MVTSPGVDPRAAFDKMRELIGATDAHTWWESPQPDSPNKYRHTMSRGYHMDIAQGLPALMWVDYERAGGLVSDGGHNEWCDDDCSGKYDDPAGYVEINFDTGYAYTAPNGASCGDLHAWIAREITAWLDAQGATWVWFDECGEGWLSDLTAGTLGDPEVGRPGSTVPRQGREDGRRAFGALAMAAVLADLQGGTR